ncbi:TniQ family protein [Ahrensia sp. 13_GOM-1096m]|uniref:TniQ family protein n=1 Tax=Ahrensia sp. 13_GOM-1096m TaxID=1380380 RepID=UPI00047E51F9|nr:TniQ family protein [Ahrensia sp. 13_GOM-1096m]
MMKTQNIDIAPFTVWCSKLEKDEPSYAFLARNVEQNTAQSPGSLYAALGHRGSHISCVSPKVIADLTRSNLEDIVDASFIDSKDESVSIIFGERISRNQCTVSTRKWCPQCLREGRYHKFVWDLNAINSCPCHQVALSNICDCGRAVHWSNSFVCIAACGCELDEIAAPTRHVTETEQAFSAYIGGRLRSSRRIKNALLDELDLNVAIQVVENLGRYRLAPSKTLKAAHQTYTRAYVCAAGYAVILDSDVEYGILLDTVLNDDRIGDFAKWGLLASYGEFRQWITELSDNTQIKHVLHEGMLKHAQKNKLVVSKRATDSSGQRIQVDRFTLQEAATYCSVSHKRLKEVAIKLGYIPLNIGSGMPVTLRRTQVEEISQRLQNRINAKELAGQLCIDRHAINRLRKAGLIKCFGEEVGLEVNQQGSQVWNSYSSNIAERFIAELDQTLRRGDQKDLSDIPTAAKNLRCSVQRIVAYLKEGRLHVREIFESAEGLKRHLISRSELRRLDSNDHPNGMSLRQASRELGFNYGTINSMRKYSLVKTISTPGAHRVSTKEIERVRRTFMVANEIIKTYDVPKQSKAVTKLLNVLGVAPFLDGDDVHQKVYLRVDVHRALKSYNQQRVSFSMDKPLPISSARKALYISNGQFSSALIKGEYLNVKSEGRSQIVEPDELQRFKRLYVTTAELVEKLELGRSHTAIQELKKRGVNPVCTLASHKGIMFLREDVKRAGMDI